MEKDMKLIAIGEKTKEEVLNDSLTEMRKIFRNVKENAGKMRNYL